MVFSANPEDYTNRGRIVTPLKDRIGSVVRTHYPLTRELGMAINDQNAWLDRDGTGRRSAIPIYMKEIVEEISRLARTSPHVNQQSGVSVRMSIANLENVVSNAERRAVLNRRALGRAPGLATSRTSSPSSRGQARADDDRGRRPRRQAHRPDRRRGGQERLRPSSRRPRIPRGRSTISSRARPSSWATRSPAGPCWSGSTRSPACASAPRSSASDRPRALSDPRPATAATASAAEFILEGLHVHNKLNKNVKAGDRRNA